VTKSTDEAKRILDAEHGFKPNLVVVIGVDSAEIVAICAANFCASTASL